ncbi:PspC domain-containing protein [Streptacidiphilus sp. 4-A2]|nr:PspC domain-containing protein [Streptacidiphilus sp. 4-A2]
MTEESVPPPDGQAAPGGATPASGEQPRSTRPPLKRSDSRRVVAGVCGGIGQHLDIDPVVFRVVIAVLCLSGGVGLFIYGMAWLIIPVERTGQNELQRLLSGKVDWQSLGAVLVTVLGTGIFFSYMDSAGHLFPLLLIALLAFAALRYNPDAFEARRRQAQPAAAQTSGAADATTVLPTDTTSTPAPAWWQRPDPLLKRPPAEPAAPADAPPTPPPATPPGVPDWALWAAAHRTAQQPTVQAAEPYPAGPHPTGPHLAEPFPAGPDPFEPVPPLPPEPPRRPGKPRPEQRQRSYLGTVFFCLAVITSGTVWLVGERTQHGVSLLAVLSSGLLVLGLGLVLGARWGRARSLVLWGTLLTLAVAAVGASPVQLRTAYDNVHWTPASSAALQPSYQLSSGAATLDLRALAPAPGQTLDTRVRVGAGALVVRLPSGPEIKVDVTVGVGMLELPDGVDNGGVSASRTLDLNPGARPPTEPSTSTSRSGRDKRRSSSEAP